jgi:RAQPRD family integrative conjugative element protein
MGQTYCNIFARLRCMAVLPWALAAAITVPQPAFAADDALEREQLAALTRQIELADRLAEHATSTAPQERARYHIDYARLRADLKVIRAGLQDYLVPQRAQPRDPVPLTGDYVRRNQRQEPSP